VIPVFTGRCFLTDKWYNNTTTKCIECSKCGTKNAAKVKAASCHGSSCQLAFPLNRMTHWRTCVLLDKSEYFYSAYYVHSRTLGLYQIHNCGQRIGIMLETRGCSQNTYFTWKCRSDSVMAATWGIIAKISVKGTTLLIDFTKELFFVVYATHSLLESILPVRIDITDMADTTDFLIPLMHGVMADEYW